MFKPKPWWLSITDKHTWVTIYPNIYYPKGCEETSKYPSMIAHENVHLDRQKALNKYVWLFSYLVNKDFRFHEEIFAMRVELATMPENQRYNRMVEQAAQLSGPMYRKCSSYNEAMFELSKPQ